MARRDNPGPGKHSVEGTKPLDTRHLQVLRLVVHEHIVSGQPVGSVRVAERSGLGLSAATIRKVLGKLEDDGLLVKPHTSAGRIPTDSGYRVFVDQVLDSPDPMPRVETDGIDLALSNRGETTEMLGEASRQLSHLSQQVGLVLAPDVKQIRLRRLEFVRVDRRRVTAILLGRSGIVHHRTLVVDPPMEQPELDRIGRYLSEAFAGKTLPQILRDLVRHLKQERATFDRLQQQSLMLCREAVSADLEVAAVFIEGASNLLDSPEFADIDVIRSLFRTLEQKQRLIELLQRMLVSPGVQVAIGEEIPVADLAHCSIVTSSYGTPGRRLGTIGVSAGDCAGGLPGADADRAHGISGRLTSSISEPTF
jgi:heat-inducible transcriptional repressor